MQVVRMLLNNVISFSIRRPLAMWQHVTHSKLKSHASSSNRCLSNNRSAGDCTKTVLEEDMWALSYHGDMMLGGCLLSTLLLPKQVSLEAVHLALQLIGKVCSLGKLDLQVTPLLSEA